MKSRFGNVEFSVRDSLLGLWSCFYTVYASEANITIEEKQYCVDVLRKKLKNVFTLLVSTFSSCSTGTPNLAF